MAWDKINAAYNEFRRVKDEWTYSQAMHYVDPWECQQTDCSGLVWWLIEKFDHECAELMVSSSGGTNTTAMQETCQFVGYDLGAMQPGDIILCNYSTTSSYMAGGASGSHVAMFVGNNTLIDMFPGVNMREYTVGSLVNVVKWWGIYRPPYTAGATDDEDGTPAFMVSIPSGEYCLDSTMNVRDASGTSSNVVATYECGETVYLDGVAEIKDGVLWGSYIGQTSGQRRWIALGKVDMCYAIKI